MFTYIRIQMASVYIVNGVELGPRLYIIICVEWIVGITESVPGFVKKKGGRI